jgi:cobalt-zinc-cadmium resistance protein CzcA
MITVPMACVGGVFALWLRGIVLSISAVVGFISLLGVCTLEGVLVVSRIHQNLKEDMQPLDAVIHGAELRLRPVMMVGLAAAIGLFPAAISTGIGSETQRPLATVVVGGMLSSLVVTLLVNPALFWLLYRRRLEEGSHHDHEDG